MAEDQLIKDQIAAMEGWAILVLRSKLNASKPDYEGAKGLLKHINRQGRKLEWRGYGIRKLPDVFTKDLKTQISSARASAQKIIDWLDKKDFEQKKELYLKLCKQYATSMTEMLKRARVTVEEEPWEPINFPKIKKEKWFASLFEQFAKRRDYYKGYHLDTSDVSNFIDLSYALLVAANLKGVNLEHFYFEEANLEGANFEKAHLKGACFDGAHLEKAHFGKANLVEVKFRKAHLKKAFLGDAYLKEANFFGADLEEAKFNGADLTEADLRKANFNGADLQEANLTGAKIERANFYEADLLGIIGLTKERLHSANNWELAKNIPPNLK